jgi:hypothetical protein
MAFKKARKCWVSAPAFDVVVLHDVEVRRAEELTLDHTYRAMTWLGEEIADGRASPRMPLKRTSTGRNIKARDV